MDFPTIVGIGALVNNAISATKNAREIAKDSTDTDLKEQISAVYDVLLDLKERTLALDEENRQLKAQLAKKADHVGPLPPNGFYYQSEDTQRQHPLCPHCFQSSPSRVAFMSSSNEGDGTMRYQCNLCKNVIYEQNRRGQYF